jgi:hypothetical protein
MFRLPANLTIGSQYQLVSSGEVTALEEALPPRSRVLVGLVFAERYEDFTKDCELAETALKEAGIPTWPEYDRFITADPDGEPIVWVSYVSSPAWWTIILLILGGAFLLPILAALPMKIVEWLFPGTMDIITTLVVVGILGGVMMFMPKMLKGGK